MTTTATVNTMKTWTDERPFEVMIRDIVLPPRTKKDPDFGCLLPASQYDHVADIIARDPKIFASQSCIYDAEVWKYESELPPLKKQLDHIQKEFTTLKSSDKDKLHELVLKERELAIKFRETEAKRNYYRSLQEITQKEFITLNRISKLWKEKENEDLEFLRKGVHFACSYANALIAKIPVPDGIKPSKY